ncbi:unnamed protein product [Rhizoctonia solani]|uniref:Ubiquitin-like domain-containing protein n=1 Tax=Rhizoctonia solani TaxID=456999 RepID=A0A8H2WNN4_9AGAM|nr:unnamed protein product [Rhizoctonia solani]
MPPAKRQRTDFPETKNYDRTIESVKRVFPQLKNMDNDDILLFVKLEQVDDSAQVVKVLWPEMAPRLVLLKVILEYSSQVLLHPNTQIRVRLLMTTGQGISLNLPINCPMDDIYEVVEVKTAGDPIFSPHFSLYLNGEKLHRGWRLNDFVVEDED